MADLVARLLAGDASLFEGDTARHSLGWLDHAQRYLGDWLDAAQRHLPRRHERTILLGMGGSSSPARFYAEGRDANLTVLDSSNPDTVASTEFAHATVIASSKSGTTIETQTLLAHALAEDLQPEDLVIVTDPGTSLAELGTSIGALVVEGDPKTGGRFSGLSPFGLVPALYAGWTPDELRAEFSEARPTREGVEAAWAAAEEIATIGASLLTLDLGGDPIVSGGALWLEQLIAETTGKSGRGVVPLSGSGARRTPSQMPHWHLVAALCARDLGVDPFDQPDVESAKRSVFARLSTGVVDPVEPVVASAAARALEDAAYVALQVFAPLEAGPAVSRLRDELASSGSAVTANLGPRYLHSTGQLHKGGPEGVLCVQVLVRPRSAPRRIQGRHYSFHDLHRVQADADAAAVRALGRRVIRLEVEDLDEAAGIVRRPT